MDTGHRIVLDHLDRMTDSTGLIQHAIYRIPRRDSGYTTDDNARALRLCARWWWHQPDERMLRRVGVYLSFVEHARRPGGGFHNYLGYDRHWLDAEGSGDCQGQAVCALAEVLGSRLPDDYRTLARELMQAVLPTLAGLQSIRAQAYVILGWGHLREAGVEEVAGLEAVARAAARRLVECYRRAQAPDWHWFEPRMTYANAVLPHALFAASRHWPGEAFLEAARASFAFLDRATTAENVFWPVGNSAWYARGEEKAQYDQQPVEAATMADAALTAFRVLGQEQYLAAFRRALGWFHGENSLRKPVIDGARGACCDGLQPSGLNRNQGAESTLSYLWAELRSFELRRSLCDNRQVAVAGT